jgi:H+-translocating NAD(P) transhydrogenase subunit alpha
VAATVYISRETVGGEPRVACSPETVKKMKALGLDVVVEAGAGTLSRIPDADYEKTGARIGSIVDAKSAEVLLKVRRPTPKEIKGYKSGAIVIAIMDPYGNEKAITEMATAGLSTFAMELMPRITRAQSMDILSSQANLAGYQAVIDAASVYDRAIPMMMTAAGTVPAAKVFVMGAGVAGLQAIATARRLGAVVSATEPPRSRSPRWVPSSSRLKTRSSRPPKPQPATPSRCRRNTRPSRPPSSPSISPSRTSSSPPRSYPVARRRVL